MIWSKVGFDMIPAVAATILFCVSAVTANRATRLAGSVGANFWRLVLATLVLSIWAHGFGGGLQGRAMGMFFASGVIGFGIGDVALYLAYPRLGSRLTLLMVQTLAAPLAAVCEWLWLGTTVSMPEILASATILLGVAFALAPAENPHLSRRDLVLGCLFGLLAAVGQGLGAVMSRVGYAMNDEGSLALDGMTVAYQRILGGLLVGGVSYLWVKTIAKTEGAATGELGWLPTRASLPWIVMTGISGPTLGVACYQMALSGTKSAVVLPIVATAPLVVMPLSLWMEGDRPGVRAIVGGVIAVCGVIALGWIA